MPQAPLRLSLDESSPSPCSSPGRERPEPTKSTCWSLCAMSEKQKASCSPGCRTGGEGGRRQVVAVACAGAYNLDGPPGQVRKSRWKAGRAGRAGWRSFPCARASREATTRSGCTWGRRLKNLHPEVGASRRGGYRRRAGAVRSAPTSPRPVEHA